ncbi:DMT family transporter [Streptomyces sp. LX-29]|uniref:DMT family transporter n=1 Tax=Streptomyces sp. LX-29 TaxID=2900152 RepID=UPI00240E257F|nr:DMT family transporter [Streptomyces sp. LX-29]WFB06088.1 DMT family transporter [Streptomyces sp. LX-29]
MAAVALSALLAVLTAAANATATVLQRVAALTVPPGQTFSLRGVRRLLRSPAWSASIAVIVLAAGGQATALALGSLTLVQPILVAELPLTLIIARVFIGTPMPRGGWRACALTAVGLALALTAAAPAEGDRPVTAATWTITLIGTGAAIALCTAGALRRRHGPTRAALFATASAISYALTAALMKESTHRFGEAGAPGLLTAWQTYGCVLAGAAALFLLANAMGSGPLIAAQPALTLGEAGFSLLLGAVLFGDRVRTGWWILPEAAGTALTAVGVLFLARLSDEHP